MKLHTSLRFCFNSFGHGKCSPWCSQVQWHMSLILVLRRRRPGELWELQASMIYTVNSHIQIPGPPRQGSETLSKNETNKKFTRRIVSECMVKKKINSSCFKSHLLRNEMTAALWIILVLDLMLLCLQYKDRRLACFCSGSGPWCRPLSYDL